MKKNKWVKLVERESDFWKNYMMISSIAGAEKIFGCPIGERLTTRKGMTFTHWQNPKAVWNCSLVIEKKIKHNPQFLNKILNVFNQSRTKLLSVNKKLEKTDFRRLSSEKLLLLYEQFCQAYKGLYPPFTLSVYIDSIEDKTKKWLRTILEEKKQEEKFDDYFIKLSIFPKPSLLQEEEFSLLNIAVKIKNKKITKKEINKLLNFHTEKYAGLPVINDEAKPWDKSYFQAQLKNTLKKSQKELTYKFNELNTYTKHIKKEQETLFKRLAAPPLIRHFFFLIGLSTWIRLVSRNTFASSHYSSKDLFSEIGRRHHLTAENIKWLNPHEVKSLILYNKLPAFKKLLDRKSTSALLFHNGRYKILEGKEAEKFIKKELGGPFVSRITDSLKGVIAYPGIVTGTAKIVIRQQDISKMKKGDILVTRMTTVDIIPAVRKASAIVTDEGGITCHAAIVSRELKIPCVVGTNFATKIIRNNDIISVDAKNGIIKL